MSFFKQAVHCAPRHIDIDISGGDQTLSTPCTGLYVGISGTLVCRLVGDAADSTWPVVAGTVVPICVKIVRQTGTTATANAFKALYPI